MSVIVNYTNLSGELISQQQLANMQEYAIKYYDNGELKKIETYIYNKKLDKVAQGGGR
jgi:hypothetical protein